MKPIVFSVIISGAFLCALVTPIQSVNAEERYGNSIARTTAQADIISQELDRIEAQIKKAKHKPSFSDTDQSDSYAQTNDSDILTYSNHDYQSQQSGSRNSSSQYIAQNPEFETYEYYDSDNNYDNLSYLQGINEEDDAEPYLLDSDWGTIHGEARASFGVETSDHDSLWKKSNFDLNERNFRLLSEDRLNNKENTFDPGIYSRLKFDMDIAPEESAFRFHSNISIDPWSFVGKSDKVTVTGSGGDEVELELLYWSNTGHTVNQTFNTLSNGDAVTIPELKVQNGVVPSTTATSTFSNIFTVPDLDINNSFQPIRELWLDFFPNDQFIFRVFPLAYGTMALTSDDPLHISNNRTYWESSPWLNNWKPGNFNSGAGDFSPGKFDNSLAFFTRDNEGTRLTGLRGISLYAKPNENTTINAVAATPKTLWQDYEDVRSIPVSIRVKSFLADNFFIGSTTNVHMGFSDAERDATNYTGSIDTGFSPIDGIKFEGQYSRSFTETDLTSTTYTRDFEGDAFYLAMTTSSEDDDNMLKQDYFALKKSDTTNSFFKTRLFFSWMDEHFESSLANYHETRDDSFFSRHIHFRKPPSEFFINGNKGMSIYDILPFAIGNGIDINRYVGGFRSDFSLNSQQLTGLFDIRNVHNATNNKFIENVTRLDLAHQTTDWLETKVFLLRQDLPKTKGGFDPFLIESSTGNFITSADVPDGEDPTLNTASFGAKLDLTPRIALHGIYEYTNDFTAASDNFPRGLLNSANFATFGENGLTFRKDLPFLYSQGFFDMPPYDYHQIIRTGLDIRPSDQLDIYFDYTRNPNKFSGQIDDNMNHIGTEITYIPTENLGFFFKYTWSRVYDLFTLVNDSVLDYESHHNFFAETNYRIDNSTSFTLQYGVGPSPSIGTATYDPFGGSLLTLDTQHLFRMLFEKTF